MLVCYFYFQDKCGKSNRLLNKYIAILFFIFLLASRHVTAAPASVLSCPTMSCPVRADLVRRARARLLLGLRLGALRRGRLGAHFDWVRAAAGQPRARRVAGM